jgi:hypothetical protein
VLRRGHARVPLANHVRGVGGRAHELGDA